MSKKAMQWRPIATAPKDGRWILVSAVGWEPEITCWSPSVWGDGWHSGGIGSDSYGTSFDPSHWMPLPPPPEDKSDKPLEGKAVIEREHEASKP